MPRPRRLMNEINVVPYIDVMLVLLVIFMVTAPLVNPGVVELPSVGKSSLPPSAPVEIVIKADRSMLLRERAPNASERSVTEAELIALLKVKQAKNPDQPVLIAGDKDVPYGAVLQVMDELNKQNVRKVGLLVKPVGK
jgi:biopolymer transport protein TolR